jgi:SAM-dependent methyltransferase
VPNIGEGRFDLVDLVGFRALMTDEGRAALEAASSALELPPIVLAERLRRRYPPSLVAAAITQARLRERASAKFGDQARGMFFTPEGLEQSTRATVARHRAARFAGSGSVVDLCCGIGGDLQALAPQVTSLVGVERDALTATVAEANTRDLGVRIAQADAETFPLDGFHAVFCDPARRSGGRRIFDVNAYSPPWSYVTSLPLRVPNVAVKVAPGIPHQLVPADAEVEWVSDGGDVKEAVLWFGDLRRDGARRRATVLPSGSSIVALDLSTPQVCAPRRYLYEPDGAVVRAHLVAEVAASVEGALLDATTAYITSDKLVATQFARAFEITDVMPFSLKRLRALLRERGVGAVTIMKRGSAVDVERLRRDLRLSGTEQAVVVLALVSGRHHALLCTPIIQ